MKSFLSLIAILLIFAGESAAQATATPSFNAPYRAFTKHEFGGTLSFPEGFNLGLEGQYRFGYQNFDLGFRGGFLDPNAAGVDNVFVAGAEGRTRLITHTENFPFDGALIVGLGGQFRSGNSVALVTGGLSLGRRIDVKDSQVSIVPYVEPTLVIASGNGNTDANFALGLGADFRLSRLFDARVSIGLGDIEGISFSAVWIR
jgi:hypothetical protein